MSIGCEKVAVRCSGYITITRWSRSTKLIGYVKRYHHTIAKALDSICTARYDVCRRPTWTPSDW